MATYEDRQLIVHDNPKSVISESFRTLRTNLQFISPDTRIKTVLVTSAAPGEGKSIVSSNLAASQAQSGNNVLLIDCDLRKPVTHKIFDFDNSIGLTSVLTGQVSLEKAVQATNNKGLKVLTSGPIPPNPAEMLQAKAMQSLLNKATGMFDQVIIDAPPVLPVADSIILAPKTDGIVIVVAASQVPKDIVLRARDLLKNTNTKILGIVLNRVKFDTEGEQYYYNYYYSEE